METPFRVGGVGWGGVGTRRPEADIGVGWGGLVIWCWPLVIFPVNMGRATGRRATGNASKSSWGRAAEEEPRMRAYGDPVAVDSVERYDTNNSILVYHCHSADTIKAYTELKEAAE